MERHCPSWPLDRSRRRVFDLGSIATTIRLASRGASPPGAKLMKVGDESAAPVNFPAEASRPGRLVAATACPGRHETPGTYLGRAERPRATAREPTLRPEARRSRRGCRW